MAATVQTQTTNRFLTCIYQPEVQTFGNKTITLKDNHDFKIEHDGKVAEYHSVNQVALRFLRSAEGVFRFGQIGEKVPKFTNAVRQLMGLPRWQPLDACASKSQLAWSWLTTVPRTIDMTPGVIQDVKEGYNALSDKTQTSEQVRFKVAKAIREGFDLLSMLSFSAANVSGLFPKMSKFTTNAIVFGESTIWVHDVTSLGMNAQNVSRANALLKSRDFVKATPAMKEAVQGSKNISWIATVKDVCSVVGGFFALLAVATGVLLLPAVISAAFSLGSSVLGIIRKIYEDTQLFKPINFLDHQTVSVITA